MAASDGTSSGIRYVCPSAACKFTFQRGNAGKNGRIAEHSSFLGTKITSCSSGGAADHPEPGGTGHGFSKKRASVKSGRGTSGSGKCSEHGHRTGCTSAVLVRNCLGVVILVVFVLIGAGPMLHYGILSLLYRLLAAVAQPVSDRRMVRALGTMGEGAHCFFGSFLLRKCCVCWHFWY